MKLSERLKDLSYAHYPGEDGKALDQAARIIALVEKHVERENPNLTRDLIAEMETSK